MGRQEKLQRRGPIEPLASFPLRSLWCHGVEVAGQPGRRLSSEDIKAALRSSEVPIVVANVGDKFEWVSGLPRFDFWKNEVQPRLVPHDAERWFLSDYPDERCYVAKERTDQSGVVAIVLELFH